MPRDTFRDDLDALRDAVFALGQRVAERVRTALTAFDTGDPDAVDDQFDITSADTCIYVVWMTTRRRLHTGDGRCRATAAG